VITVTGTIVSGPSTAPGLFGGGFTAGSETVEEQLRAAGRSDSVKAVVLRVDSPGGSSFASDEIWRAVERLQEKDKPVVVSMGGAAASGGYYVSAGADAIFANPSTITGSIGVYAGPLFSLEGLFDKIGVETEIYTRGRRAAMYSLSKPMDPVEFAALDRLVGETYRQFKQRVADGRDMTPEAVEAAARGRVWSGKAALDQGLVDELGGFFDAVADARARAGIPDEAHVELVAFSTRLGPGGEAARRSLRAASRVVGFEPEPLPTLLPPELAAIARWQSLSDERVWALMPYQLSVE
jgi:protease-4